MGWIGQDHVGTALEMAHSCGGLQPGCVIHSDRGGEYTADQFKGKITDYEYT